jgi:hypothetical protein
VGAGSHSGYPYLDNFLGEEFGEVCRASLEHDTNNYIDELVDVAASAIAAIHSAILKKSLAKSDDGGLVPPSDLKLGDRVVRKDDLLTNVVRVISITPSLIHPNITEIEFSDGVIVGHDLYDLRGNRASYLRVTHVRNTVEGKS